MEEKKFIVGKWYKSNYRANYYYYLKVLRVMSRDYIIGEKIKSTGEYVSDDRWTSPNTCDQALEIGLLTDLSEIQKYLPERHPDKIVPEQLLTNIL